MNNQNPYQAPEAEKTPDIGTCQALLRERLFRQRLAAQVIAASLSIYAALRLLTAAGQLMAIRSTDAVDEYLGEVQAGVNWDHLIQCIVGLCVGGAMGTFAVMFGMYARRLRETAKGRLSVDRLIQTQTSLWYVGAGLGIIYIVSQILRLFELPRIAWLLLDW